MPGSHGGWQYGTDGTSVTPDTNTWHRKEDADRGTEVHASSRIGRGSPTQHQRHRWMRVVVADGNPVGIAIPVSVRVRRGVRRDVHGYREL